MNDVGSSSDPKVQRCLQDLAEFGADAAYTVGLGVDEFLADTPHGRVLRNNGRHILIQIATVVEKLPNLFIQTHPAVDWVAITRLRNLIAHHYDKVDDRLVFSTLQRRVPELMSTLGVDR